VKNGVGLGTKLGIYQVAAVYLLYILCVKNLCVLQKFKLIWVHCDLVFAILGCAFHNLSTSSSYYKG